MAQVGGNRKPQTFRPCEYCGQMWGPLPRLAQRFCSYACKVAAQTTGRTKGRAPRTREAQRAQRTLAYHVQRGNVIRPSECEQCGATGRIEGAHYSYAEPLRVRWLCVSCHRRWDWAEPKGGVQRWENFTGKTAVLDG